MGSTAVLCTFEFVPHVLSLFPVGQGCTNTGRLVSHAIRFSTVTPNIFDIIIAVCLPAYRMCSRSHALSGKCQLTVRFTGHSGIVGLQYRNCFWRPEFGGEL